jgi:hypothetical protein
MRAIYFELILLTAVLMQCSLSWQRHNTVSGIEDVPLSRRMFSSVRSINPLPTTALAYRATWSMRALP